MFVPSGGRAEEKGRRLVLDKKLGTVGAVKPPPARHLLEAVGKNGSPILEKVIILIFVHPYGRDKCVAVEPKIEVMSECEDQELKRRGRHEAAVIENT